MIAAIILAAGESARMGHPKALLSYRGEPFLAGMLKACYAVGLDRRVVVLGHHADKVLSFIDLSDVTTVRSEELTAGPIGSIRAGIRLLADHPIDGVVVWPVDRPHVTTATVAALIDGFRSGGGPGVGVGAGGRPIVLPVHAGRRGHPVLFGRAVFDELLAVPEGEGARSVVRADPSRVFMVPVDDPAVLEDFNTPEEYRDLLRRENQLGE